MASVNITRTPSSNGNQKKWTWSGWIKNNGKSGDNIPIFNGSILRKDNHRYSYVCFQDMEQ